VIANAKLKYLGVSAQKARLVANQVRGRNVNDALTILRYSPKLVARDLAKLLKSAVANAQHKDPNIDVDELVVSRLLVDDAPPLKRTQHRAMGRVFQVLKRSCHLAVDLDVPGPKAQS